jgi:hypothetical protein
MAVGITFGGSDQVVLAFLRRQVEAIVARLSRQLNLSMIKLQRYIVTEELSGQVLQNKTGLLAGSINAIPTTAQGSEITASVEGAGGPAWYGQVQERGGTSEYEIAPVNKKALAFFPGGSLGGGGGIAQVAKGTLKGLYQRGRSGFGRELRPSKLSQFSSLGGVVVKKVIHPPLPKRPFMSPALTAMRDTIVQDLQKAVTGRA